MYQNTIINEDYALNYISERELYDLIDTVDKVVHLKGNVRTNMYKDAIKGLRKFYNFYDEDDTIECVLLLEKSIVVEKVQLTEDAIIALARSGIIAIPKN